MVFNEKLPFGRCSENIKDVVSFSKFKKHLVRSVPMKIFSQRFGNTLAKHPRWKASHKDVFLGYLQSFRTRFSQEQLQFLLENTSFYLVTIGNACMSH